ncbi:MAG: MFS transporter [Leptothrix sp. (in: Bacteria)]|nr:MFS transporter [Leptothrix sp. (in: b-proteobacteria)]
MSAPATVTAAAPSRPLVRLGALSFAYFAAIGLFNPYAPLWFQSLGFSTLLIGTLASLQSWTRVLAPYAWSWWGDHGGRRVELIRLAALGALLAALGLFGVRAAVPVALVVTLLFLANSGVVPLYEALLSQHLNTARGIDPARYGRVRMWGSVGFIVSVTGFGALLEAAGIAVFPWFVATMNALLLAAAVRLPATRSEVAHAEPAPPVMQLLRQPAVAWFFASVFFTVLAHSSLYAFFSLYLVSLGYGKAAVGAFWAVSVVVEIAFFWFQGHFFHRLSPVGWLKLVAAVTTLRFAAVAAGGSVPAVLLLAQAAHAISFAAHHAACISLVHRHFPERLRGRGQALYTTLGYGLSGVLGGVGGGWIIQHFGYAAVFWAAAGAGVLAWGCAHRAADRHP